VFGNTSAAVAADCATRLCAVAGRRVAVVAGAARAVFASAVPRSIYPLDVACALTVGVAELRAWSRASPASGTTLGAYLARHSWRWLAYAPLRYRRLRFPLWDLVPALDALGLLSGVHVERQLACVGRGLLVDDAAATPAGVLTSFDPRAARAAFRAIIM
jgi:hypothetical protein